MESEITHAKTAFVRQQTRCGQNITTGQQRTYVQPFELYKTWKKARVLTPVDHSVEKDTGGVLRRNCHKITDNRHFSHIFSYDYLTHSRRNRYTCILINQVVYTGRIISRLSYMLYDLLVLHFIRNTHVS